MGLNIVARRRVSLKGFAQGWDDCFITVKAVNEKQRNEYMERLGDTKDDEVAARVTREACLDVILGGRIINTDEAGNEAPYDFNHSEVEEVVEALSFPWQTEILSVATGADRLKATISSI